MQPPFAGLRVVETAGVLAGPLVGQFFAELGAEVIKVEHPNGGDVTRQWRLPAEPDDAISHYFSATNWGKQSVALDLATGAGREALTGLLAKADIWVDNLRPGAAERLGLDLPAIRAANPGLIHACLTAYGPDDDRPGYDAALQAETGFMALNGTEATGPLKFPLALVDVLAAHQLKEAVLVALIQRAENGTGRDIGVSLHDAGVSMWANQAAAWLVAGEKPRNMGSAHPSIVPYGTVFPCADGEALVLAVGNDAQFQRLCAVLGKPDWADDSRYTTNPARVRNRDALCSGIAAALRTRDRDSWLQRLTAQNVPASAVLGLDSALQQSAAEPLLVRDAGRVGLRTAVFTGIHPAVPLMAPQVLGAGTDQVLRQWLQWDDQRMRRPGIGISA